ncbi:hypothetical protein MPNT_50004 [Candidatus Methylacidithermus pantelleriae]|uniref:Uncharacterized protein n=1 Tax=Candidatus Methylacidithermus pantelleriae TaxID=2744239 RepID=A0A8J2BPU6_9BACT|nr:hypothetical protein MPNT_50004 [Candidatus Methylacidithermus pantelleriae]
MAGVKASNHNDAYTPHLLWLEEAWPHGKATVPRKPPNSDAKLLGELNLVSPLEGLMAEKAFMRGNFLKKGGLCLIRNVISTPGGNA